MSFLIFRFRRLSELLRKKGLNEVRQALKYTYWLQPWIYVSKVAGHPDNDEWENIIIIFCL